MGRTLIYPQEFAAWADAPAPTLAQVERASLHVLAALRGYAFAVDASGMPTDPALLSALRDATLHQVAAIVEADKVAAGESLGPLVSASIGSASYTLRAPSTGNLDAVAAGQLVTEARLALSAVPMTRPVYVHG